MTVDEAASAAVEIRRLSSADLEGVALLLDSTLGSGFWELDSSRAESRLVAALGDRVVGVATARVEDEPQASVEVRLPVGVVNLVSVDPPLRGQGIATRLVTGVCERCEQLGAESLLVYAWVHAPTGEVPLAGVLQRLGFRRVRRVEHFYAGATQATCPVCDGLPCICSADVYVRDLRSVGP